MEEKISLLISDFTKKECYYKVLEGYSIKKGIIYAKV
jgi:hypothetical protein